MSAILVVEDELNVGTTLIERLQNEGFKTTWSKNKKDTLQQLSSLHRFDLALLDVGLPDGNGFDIATEIRKKSPTTAIIFLTAFSNPEDRVRGLELGAEDYVIKPFHY